MALGRAELWHRVYATSTGCVLQRKQQQQQAMDASYRGGGGDGQVTPTARAVHRDALVVSPRRRRATGGQADQAGAVHCHLSLPTRSTRADPVDDWHDVCEPDPDLRPDRAVLDADGDRRGHGEPRARQADLGGRGGE